jgi:putative tryptophan/tyrosine transport system substrate-binding protein
MPMEHWGSRWSRRQVVAGAAGFGLVAGCGRWPGQADAPAKAPRAVRIGILTASSSPGPGPINQLRQGLRDLGYEEDRNFTIEPRASDGHNESLPGLAAELAALPVDIMVTISTPCTQAAKDTTSTIPIVMVAGGDPVETGLVASLARPGGNVTGLTRFERPLTTKRLQLLKETVPTIARVMVLWTSANRGLEGAVSDVRRAGDLLGIQVEVLTARSAEDVDAAFNAADQGGADALLTLDDAVVNTNYARIVDAAATRRLPAMYHTRGWVTVGGLMAYGVDVAAVSRRAAYYVDRILKGAKPADLPVEQPMTFDFVVNLRTARELGITFPHEIMLQVTEVIQ